MCPCRPRGSSEAVAVAHLRAQAAAGAGGEKEVLEKGVAVTMGMEK